MEAAQEKLTRLESVGSPPTASQAKPQAPVPAAPRPVPADELPDYRAEDLAARSREDPRFAALVAEAQRILGRILSSSDLKKLFGLYDYLALPPEVLMMLLTHCARSSPSGNAPSMRMIEKEGYIWANREILTLEQAEEYIADSERRRESLARTARLLGITGRTLSATERKYLSAWLDMGFGDELIAIALDKTVTNTGSLKWRYMDGILRSWHDKGLHTPEDVRDRDGRRPSQAQDAKPDAPRDLDKLLKDLERI
jgi:DnaD/phage-associated family protein